MSTKPFTGEGPFVGVVKNSVPAPEILSDIPHSCFRLSFNGKTIGWLGTGGSSKMWAVVVSTKSQAQPWNPYNPGYHGPAYYISAGDNSGNYMTWSGGLSGAPVAFNGWAYANKWQTIDKQLFASDSNEPLSTYGVPSVGSWLYANNGSGYSVLDVDVETY